MEEEKVGFILLRGSSRYIFLKHITTLFSSFDHDILSREWIVIVDLVQINYHGGLWY